MGGGERKWYLLQAKLNQHDKALSNLRNQSYECCSPTVSLPKIVRGKKRMKVEALFPGYIFIRLHLDCSWRGISCTRGVKSFVRFGPYPFVVPDRVVDGLLTSVERFRHRLNEDNEFRAGDPVKIAASGFDEFSAIYKCKVGSTRSIILIQYIHRVHEVIVRTDRLKRVN